jgi:hypothetical protein
VQGRAAGPSQARASARPMGGTAVSGQPLRQPGRGRDDSWGTARVSNQPGETEVPTGGEPRGHPRCGPGLAPGGLWGRLAGAGAWV